MARHSLVSVFTVGPDGATGDLVATGTLVHPLLVLVDQAHSARLERAADGPLRVGVAAISPRGQASVEVIDAAGIHREEDADGEPLVALDLQRSARCTPEPLPQDGGALREELRRLAHERPQARPEAEELGPPGGGLRPPGLPGWPPSDVGHPLCLLFPRAPFCRTGPGRRTGGEP